MSDKTDKDEKPVEPRPDQPDTQADDKATTGRKPAEKKSAENKSAAAKSSKSGFLVPLLIIAVFAGFLWAVTTGKIDLGVGVHKPQMIPLDGNDSQQSAPAASTAPDSKPDETAKPAAANAAPATAPTVTTPSRKVEMRLENSIPKTKPSPTPLPKTISNEQAQQLLDAVQGLSKELNQLRDEQAAMQTALQQQRHINLEARLRWIADASSHLPQIQLAWEEISLLPGLNQDQRQQAESMLALAQKDALQIRQWQINLEKWADTLSTPTHENVIPKPSHPLLAWIAGQFRLSRAPSIEESRLDTMRLALLDTSKRIAMESWPNRQEWQTLRARLLLQLQQMQLAETDNTPQLGLPENFDAIAKDIETLRETARQWLERGA